MKEKNWWGSFKQLACALKKRFSAKKWFKGSSSYSLLEGLIVSMYQIVFKFMEILKYYLSMAEQSEEHEWGRFGRIINDKLRITGHFFSCLVVREVVPFRESLKGHLKFLALSLSWPFAMVKECEPSKNVFKLLNFCSLFPVSLPLRRQHLP